ncbi:CAAX amino terminal protease self- immunity [Andreesenia angusta]|uniref:CAAX amino terminal protease self-immunity n=1 Tax=Andreesenia angusta TaxID=39480 RepID=A0A1S1V581_9FIRM|nr:type II CAAX endopeptidase family protein [Andreesenia angusta]OHW61644.1 CAAX amino terminal protease self- immunity [Andreesenia angusta]
MTRKATVSFAWVFFYLTVYMSLQLGYSFLSKLLEQFGMQPESGVGSTIIMAGITAVLVYIAILRLRDKSFLNECRFRAISGRHLATSAVLGISGLAVSSLLLAGLSMFLDSAYLEHMENMELILKGNKFIVFASVGIAAPIVEEVIFRGLIFRELEKVMSIKATVVVQALLFGIYHFNVAQGIYTVFLGIVLGLSLAWTRSIWAPIVIHMVNNSVSYAFSFLSDKNEVVLSVVGLVLMLALILFPVLMRYLYKTRVDRRFTAHRN